MVNRDQIRMQIINEIYQHYIQYNVTYILKQLVFTVFDIPYVPELAESKAYKLLLWYSFRSESKHLQLFRQPNNLHWLVRINWTEFLDCYRYWVLVFLEYSDGTTFSNFWKREPKQDLSLILHAAKFTVRSDLLISPKLVMKSYK